MPVQGTCPFCQEQKLLVESHILPEFLHTRLYGDKGHMMAINGQGRYGAKTLQSGMKEHLFCEECEQFFSKNFERPFSLHWMNAATNPLPEVWPRSEVIDCRFNYAEFKLFHLLNLYRAGASGLPTFQHVQLGPHQEKPRLMLRSLDAGSADQYPLAGLALHDRDTMQKEWLITVPEKLRADHHVSWAWMYGGVYWKVGVSQGFLPNIKKMSLKEDGMMRFQAHPWQDFTVMHLARDMLEGKETRKSK